MGKMKYSKSDIIGIILATFAIVFALWMLSEVWALGKKSKDFEIVCINGHEYYRASFGSKGYLAIKLDYDGKPCNCIEATQ
jgi:hypothetical protein